MDVPYRCPTCGDSEKFSSLHELRSHLEIKHAYRSSQLHRVLNKANLDTAKEVFIGYHSPLLDLYRADAQKLEENIKKLKEEELNNKRIRTNFPEPVLLERNLANNRRKIGHISEKASFRRYGHPSRLNKHFNSLNMPRTENYNLRHLQPPISLSNHEDTEDDSNPYLNQMAPDFGERTFERLQYEAPQNLTYLHSSTRAETISSPYDKRHLSNPIADKYVNETLTSLSHEVIMERASQQATADSLYAAQEVLSGVEQAAELKISHQQKVIQSLALELNQKERRLINIVHEMENLHHQQFQNLEIVSCLRQKSETETKSLHQELERKQRELDTLNKRILETQESEMKSNISNSVKQSNPENINKALSDSLIVPSPGSHATVDNEDTSQFHINEQKLDMHNSKAQMTPEKLVENEFSSFKDDELKKIKSKAQQLEREKQNLLMEMQNLLETAATDNDKLQKELEFQQEKLQKLNLDLEQSKQEQAELLGATSALYRQADISLAKLKTLLKERDQQLSSMSNSLLNAKETQEKLAKERDECKQLAVERETAYQSMLASNNLQVQTLKETLDSNQSEKLKLEQRMQQLRSELASKIEKDKDQVENVSLLKAKLAEKDKSQTKLKEEVRKREEKLKKAKHEMERVTEYLNNTAVKELEARAKLEAFISELIDRAGRAEAELARLKASHPSRPSHKRKQSRKNLVPDLSQFPGVSDVSFLEGKPLHSDVFISDCRNTGFQDVPDQLRQNYRLFHSTPKKHVTSNSFAPGGLEENTVRREKGRKLENLKKSPDDGKIGRIEHAKENYYSDGACSIAHSLNVMQQESNNGIDTCAQQFSTDIQNDNLIALDQSCQCLSPIEHSHLLDTQSKYSWQQPFRMNYHGNISPQLADKDNQNQHYLSTDTAQNLQEERQATSQIQEFHPEKSTSRVVIQTTTTLSEFLPFPNTVLPKGNDMTTDCMKFGMLNVPSTLRKESSAHTFPDVQQKSASTLCHISSPSLSTDISNSNRARENLYVNGAFSVQHQVPICNTPPASMAYGQGPPSNLHGGQYSYPASHLYEPNSLIFENTPEVERIFKDVSKYGYLLHDGLLSKQNMPEGSNTGVQLVRRKLYKKDLSLDDNGILWDRECPSSLSLSRKLSPLRKDGTGNALKNQESKSLKFDDTDIDEDLTDFIYEEQNSHEESEEAENILSKPKRTSPNKMTKSRVTTLQRDPPPLGEKIEKLLASLGPEAVNSTARQDYQKNVFGQELQKAKYKTSRTGITTSPHKIANDYSSTESSISSPLHMAKDVQRRVEQLTSRKPTIYRRSSSSKQSDGFEPGACNVESDFSSSSYASLAPASKPVEQTISKSNFRNAEKVNSVSKLNEFNNIRASQKDGESKKNKTMINDNHHAHVEATEELCTKTVVRKEKQTYFWPEKSSVFDDDKRHGLSKVEYANKDAHLALLPNKMLQKDEDISKTKQTSLEESKSNKMPYQTSIDKNKASSSVVTFQRSQTVSEPTMAVTETQATENVVQEKTDSQELAKYTDAELKPARELRARFTSDIQVTSSDEDTLDDNLTSQASLAHRESVDVWTDTDIEKLAMPGYLQKGFPVKKTKTCINRKKARRRAPMKRATSKEILSSSSDDLDDEQQAKREAVRKMRVALFRVFAYLDLHTLQVVSCVSREWCKISRHSALWQQITLRDNIISSEFLFTLSKWCTKTRSLSLQGLKGRGQRDEESPEDYQQAIRGSLEPGLEKFLSTCQDSMTVLHIKDCDNILTDKCLWFVSGYCRNLITLSYQSSIDPITPQLMWALGGGCPGVTSLHVQPQQPFQKTNAMNNRCLLLISQFYMNIQELGLGGKEFDMAGLTTLVKSCQHLRKLHFDYCLPITAKLASTLCKQGLKQLQVLSIVGTTVEAKALQTFQGSCRQLQKIYVSVTIQDCVPYPSTKKNKDTYKKMVKTLEDLKKKAAFGVIFTLEAGPAD